MKESVLQRKTIFFAALASVKSALSVLITLIYHFILILLLWVVMVHECYIFPHILLVT